VALDSIVIDNTVFNYFLRLEKPDLSHVLRETLSGRVFVPSEVVVELENLTRSFPEFTARMEKLRNQIVRNNFFVHCHSFDSVVLEGALSHMQKGEAEAVAQCKKRRIRYFITDDFRCQTFIRKHHGDIETRSSFFLLAVADLHGLVPDYVEMFTQYHSIVRINDFGVRKRAQHQKRLIDEYSHAARLYGVRRTDAEIEGKTSLELLLRN
jgi:predicted nucleic acid-binding protein